MSEIKNDYPYEQWSKREKSLYALIGFKPAHPAYRICTSCNENGHYYLECPSGGLFDALAEALYERD